ncbi:hypothetical protein EDD15DRAFT_116788 [Pisolithus albus]|nr:hypothetical protein EDD15DRAFT_116788 [Pisolithus albus]
MSYMSSVTDSEATINAFVNTIRPTFDAIIATTAFSACLLTLFALLLALSTKESRRRVVFRLNVLAICTALITSIFAGLCSWKAIIDPYNPVSASVLIAASAFIYFPPLLYDSILLTRLFALYPPFSTPPTTLLKIFAFPFCVKCARAVFISLCIDDIVRGVTTTVTGVLVQDEATIWFRNPHVIAECTLQIADNMYSAGLFLHNLHVRARPLACGGGIPNRIRQVFYISVANFIFPLAFNITLLIFVTTDHSPNSGGGLLLLINNYVTVIGVMCATIWFSRSEWTPTRKEPLSEEMLRRKLNLQRIPVSGRMRLGDVVVAIERTHTVGLAGANGFEATHCADDRG